MENKNQLNKPTISIDSIYKPYRSVRVGINITVGGDYDSTSWQVSLTPDFGKNQVIDAVYRCSMLKSYYATDWLECGYTYYVRANYWVGDNVSDWSDTLILKISDSHNDD